MQHAEISPHLLPCLRIDLRMPKVHDQNRTRLLGIVPHLVLLRCTAQDSEHMRPISPIRTRRAEALRKSSLLGLAKPEPADRVGYVRQRNGQDSEQIRPMELRLYWLAHEGIVEDQHLPLLPVHRRPLRPPPSLGLLPHLQPWRVVLRHDNRKVQPPPMVRRAACTPNSQQHC